MLTFLKYLIQLILAPGHGWEDIYRDNPDPDLLLRKGIYPLLGVAAASESLALIYDRESTLAGVLIHAISDFGAYFIAIFIARLIFDMYLGRITVSEPDSRRQGQLIVCGIGLMVLARILCNCVPWHLVILNFLPVYVVMVLYKDMKYVGVEPGNEWRWLALVTCAIVLVPLVIYNLLYLVTQ